MGPPHPAAGYEDAALRSRGAADEREGMEPRTEVPSAAVHEQARVRGDVVDPDEGEGDDPARRRGPGPARHPADLRPLQGDGIAAGRRDVPENPEAHELPPDVAAVRAPGDDLLPDVAALREADRAVRGGLEGEGVLPHVDPDSREAGLDAEDLERLPAHGGDARPVEGGPRGTKVASRGPQDDGGFAEPRRPEGVHARLPVQGERHERSGG